MSKIINVDDIEENMILSEPVLNKFGQTLIADGCVLFEKHKKILKTWNIKTIMVKGSTQEEEITISEELKQQLKAALLKRMLFTPETNIEIDLFESAVVHQALKAPREKHGELS